MDALRKELEEELKLSTEDPRSQAWYHGPLTREVQPSTANLHKYDTNGKTNGGCPPGCRGSFRQGRGLPGARLQLVSGRIRPQLLLEGRAHALQGHTGAAETQKGAAAGFSLFIEISKMLVLAHFEMCVRQGYPRALFQFEDDRFDNLPALIRFYVANRRPISQASGAIIFHPLTRTLPLRVIAERQRAAEAKSHVERGKRLSFSSAPGDALHANPLLRSGSHPSNLENLGCRPLLQSAQSDSNLRPGTPQRAKPENAGPPPISPVFRTGSEPLLSPKPRQTRTCHPGGGATLRGSDGQLHSRAPPKPLRISVVFPKASLLATPLDRDDDPSVFYDELVVQVPQSRRKGHVDRLRAEEKWQSRARITETSFGFLEAENSDEAASRLPRLPDNEHFERPQVEWSSCFQLDRFKSLLLPDNNRPLEPSVLLELKELFARTDPNTTALHLLSVDCQVARIVDVTAEQRRTMGVASGLELITLPHGRQLRQDLLERHHLIALGVVVDILGCTGTVSQRATVLHKFILLAQALKEHAHDLYAFSAVMKALDMPQVVRLQMMWRLLRRNHTESAVLFEKTLKPFMNSLNDSDECISGVPVAVPHLIPVLLLMEGQDLVEDSHQGCQMLFDLLQAARRHAAQARQHQEHAKALLASGWTPVPELLEAFRTEFALRLFWGQSGAEADSKERHEKFDKILCVLSDKLEPVEIRPEEQQPLS
ncbi:breast cancer anti-estrogen resistance protein 3 homolog isoform X3 [Syngnathus scovelli]|nr:breast cancer anti-estrogen resistance protein 3 homolog isoform X3 [Syngnathus scovelli]